MNKLQINNLINPLLDIYNDIEIDLIKKILEVADNYNGVTGSLEWYLDKLMQSNLIDSETLKILNNNKPKIKKLLTDILQKRIKGIDYLKEVNNYENLFNGNSFNLVISNAVNDVDDILNLIDSRIIESANKEYKKLLNKAYVETASGAYTYTESIRHTITELANKGFIVGNYDNGKTMSIESIVRRDVVTRINKTVGEQTLKICESLGTNLVYVDAHLGARTRTEYMTHDYEAHSEWQGKIYMINGSNEKYPNLYNSTGYGEMLGLYGINCYHNMYPYFEGDEIPKDIDAEENSKVYKLTQEQRELERRKRKYQRLLEISHNNVDQIKYHKLLKRTNDKIKIFVKENNLRRDYSREQISNKK